MAGAWAVPFGAQFGATAKAYYKNFAESAFATLSGEGITVVNVKVKSLLFGGDNITIEDKDPVASQAFRVKVGQVFLDAVTSTVPEVSADP